MDRVLGALLTLMAISLAPAWAQPADDRSVPSPQFEQRSAAGPQDQSRDMPGMGMHGMSSGAAMTSMAESMKAMAEMCRQMMEREMALMPLKNAASIVFGLLLLIALVLLIVLQLQWIVYWKRLLSSPRSS